MQKPNKENSGIKQALLDLKKAGGFTDCIDSLLKQIELDNDMLKSADELFRSHRYPDSSLDWFKLHSDIEFTRFLSPNALMILIVMCQNMRHGNLLQASYRDLSAITHITSLKAIRPALCELENCGCVTVRIRGTTRRSTVYMINPEIATVGTDTKGLTYIFWKIVRENCIATGKDKEDDRDYGEPKKNGEINWDKYPESSIRDNWESLTKERTYSKGLDKLEVGSQKIYFSKINEPKIKKETKAKRLPENMDNKKSSSVNTGQQESSTGIISLENVRKSREKTEPEACLEDDDISKLPF